MTSDIWLTLFPAFSFALFKQRHIAFEVTRGVDISASGDITIALQDGFTELIGLCLDVVPLFHISANKITDIFAGRFVQTVFADHARDKFR